MRSSDTTWGMFCMNTVSKYIEKSTCLLLWLCIPEKNKQLNKYREEAISHLTLVSWSMFSSWFLTLGTAHKINSFLWVFCVFPPPLFFLKLTDTKKHLLEKALRIILRNILPEFRKVRAHTSINSPPFPSRHGKMLFQQTCFVLHSFTLWKSGYRCQWFCNKDGHHKGSFLHEVMGIQNPNWAVYSYPSL